MRTIKVNNEEKPIKFGLNALREYGRLMGIPANTLFSVTEDSFTLDQLLTLIYCGFKDGARKEGKEFTTTKAGKEVPTTIEDLADWIDDDPTIVDQAIDEFKESLAPASQTKGKKKVTTPVRK